MIHQDLHVRGLNEKFYKTFVFLGHSPRKEAVVPAVE